MRYFVLIASLLPTVALAQEQSAAVDMASSQQYASMLPLVLIFCVFYFVLIRPQQKRMKEHQAMLSVLAKNDEVVTAGGIVGKITKADAGETVTVEIAKGVEVSVMKATIATVRGKTPSKTGSDKKKSPNDNRVPSRDSVANDN